MGAKGLLMTVSATKVQFNLGLSALEMTSSSEGRGKPYQDPCHFMTCCKPPRPCADARTDCEVSEWLVSQKQKRTCGTNTVLIVQ